jgi:integrase
MDGLDEREKVFYVVSYLQNMYRARIPYTKVRALIQAMRHRYRLCMVNADFLENPTISLAMRACKQNVDIRSEHAKRQRTRKGVVSPEMIKLYRTMYGQRTSSTEERMAYVSAALALNFLLRPGQYCSKKDRRHLIMAEDITFLFNDNATVTQMQPWEIKTHHLKGITSMVLVIHSQKNSTLRTEKYIQQRTREEKELLTDMAQHCIDSRVRASDPLFSLNRKGRNLKLTWDSATSCLRKVVATTNVKAKITLHSLRVGGATSLACGGSSREEIKQIGQWSTKADNDQLYTRATLNNTSVFSTVQGANSLTNAMVTYMDPHLLPSHVSMGGGNKRRLIK